MKIYSIAIIAAIATSACIVQNDDENVVSDAMMLGKGGSSSVSSSSTGRFALATSSVAHSSSSGGFECGPILDRAPIADNTTWNNGCDWCNGPGCEELDEPCGQVVPGYFGVVCPDGVTMSQDDGCFSLIDRYGRPILCCCP